MTSRRTFVQLAAGGIGLAAASRARSAVAASDKIQVGFIGVGRQGTSRLNEFMRQPDVVAAAVCDLDTTHVDAAVCSRRESAGPQARQLSRFPKIAGAQRPRRGDDRDARSLARAARDHACQAGKDVFVEKPLAYSIGEGRAMVNAAAEAQAHHPDGQSHSQRPADVPARGGGDQIRRAGADPSRGLFAGHGQHAVGRPRRTALRPPELDYEFWLGPAPKRPYNPLRSHFTYRYFWDYSGGALIDFWCHYTDVVALGARSEGAEERLGRRRTLGR